jgi:hypothetical protein
VTISTEAKRLAAALNLAGVSLADEDAESIQARISRRGLGHAIGDLNETYEVLLNMGPFVIRSESEFGYWSNDFGFVFTKDAATGYSSTDAEDPQQLTRIKVLTPDAVFVAYAEAVDFDASRAPALEAF